MTNERLLERSIFIAMTSARGFQRTPAWRDERSRRDLSVFVPIGDGGCSLGA